MSELHNPVAKSGYGPPHSDWNMTALLVELAKAAKGENGENGETIISGSDLIDLWTANRVRLLLKHEVSFSLECSECQGCTSGDGVDSLEKAIELGWREIEPAPADCPLSHFYGLCPEHVAEAAKGE